MKILIVNLFYFPNMIGGTEYSVKLLAEGLTKEGHEVCVYTLDGSEELKIDNPEIYNGVKVFRGFLPSLYRRRILNDKTNLADKIKNVASCFINPQANRDFELVIRRTNPDIIHTNNLSSISYWIFKYARKKNIPIVHTLRDYWLLDPTTIPDTTPKIISMFYKIIFRRVSNSMSGIVTAPSRRTLDIFKNNGYFKKQKSECVVNSIDFDRKLLEKCLADKRERTGTVQFIYAGALTENKGIKIMLEAFLKSEVDAKLLLCGGGSLETWVWNFTKEDDRVILCGKLSQEELFEYYNQADVIIVPSIWEEPFGRIVIEAAQYGLPIIGSDAGGIPEIINNLKFGRCYHRTDMNELASLINEFSDRENLKQWIVNGPQDMECYCIRKQIDAFQEIYVTLTQNRSGKNR